MAEMKNSWGWPECIPSGKKIAAANIPGIHRPGTHGSAIPRKAESTSLQSQCSLSMVEAIDGGSCVQFYT